MQSTSEEDHSQPHPQKQQVPVAAPPPPPWMAAMQYYPRPVMVPHQMMGAGVPPPYAQHYVQYYQAHQYQQHQHYYQQQQGVGSSEENKTIWAGDLQCWMDESYLHSCFAHTGEVVSVKVIRNKQTGQSEGYGFVKFLSHGAADNVLQNFSGIVMPSTDMTFRLNWASFGMGERRADAGSDLSIFVGDLASDVTDALLEETFACKYSSVKGAKVVIDANTGRSKGYGFVRFGEDDEKEQAMNEMNGAYCSTRPMRISAATPRKSGGFTSNGFQGTQTEGDSSNTTVFVGGLHPDAKEEDLRQAFSRFGEILSVKIPGGKHCGFVQFVHRNNAEEALEMLNGTMICNQMVRLSWGRNLANKQVRTDPSNQWNDQYYGPQVYNGFVYAAPPHYPSMYAAAAYGAYPMYGKQVS